MQVHIKSMPVWRWKIETTCKSNYYYLLLHLNSSGQFLQVRSNVVSNSARSDGRFELAVSVLGPNSSGEGLLYEVILLSLSLLTSLRLWKIS